MKPNRFGACVILVSFLAMAGCASSALEEEKRKAMEADIDDILAQELDPAEVGEPKTCLSDSEFRSYGALGDRHLLFEGRQGKQWVNFLRGGCPALRYDSVFVMKPGLAGRLCDMDRFNVVPRGDALSRANSAPTCILGEFRPVTAKQVEEVRERLEMR